MADEIDRLLAARTLAPPEDFAARIAALARVAPQRGERPRDPRPWQWVSLAAGAGFGALVLGQFVFFAFLAGAAR